MLRARYDHLSRVRWSSAAWPYGRRCLHGQGSLTVPPLRRRGGFSLVELVIVVTIIGILASIAVPRMSSVANRATENALQATLTNVRKAIDLYFAEHDSYPGYDPGTTTPNDDEFVNQLLMYSNALGETQATYGYPFIFGPYIRSPFPKNPFNGLAKVHVKATPADADPADGSVGWVAVLSHGFFGISATDSELDQIGIKDADRKSDVRGTLAE